jgi:hypothetical protein
MVRRSLIGRTAHTVARTAVIAGTATAVSGAIAGRQRGNAAPPSEPAAPGALSAEAIAQLHKLAELRDAGVLTEQEFAEQKARLLN